jgi:serine/threonine-protein kinase
MRFGSSLATRVFLITALLLVVSVGAAVLVTSYFGRQVSEDAVREALQESHAAQSTAQQQSYEQLALAGQLFVSDPALQSYLAEATANRDVGSLLDLLGERQADLGYDFAIVLDPDGKVVARTDAPGSSGEDLSARGLVRRALDANEGAGVWQEGDRLYFAVAVPAIKAFILQGYLITGFAIDDALALEVRRTSGADVTYLARTGAGPRPVASTLDAATSARLLDALRGQGDLLARVLERGQAVEEVRLSVGGAEGAALLSPLFDAAGQPNGAVVALASLSKTTAGYRRIQEVLVLVGLAAVLLAGALSYLLSRRAMQPVRRLVAAAEAARHGNYDQKISTGRHDEVGRLARTFDVLLADLREKRDMEAYVTELSRNLPDAGGGGGQAAAPPRAVPLALLGLEFKHLARPRLARNPTEAIDRLGRDVRRVATAVASRHGRVESVMGHRVLAAFEGETRAFSALAAAADAIKALGVKENAFEESEPPAAVVSAGDGVTGGLAWGQGGGAAVIGLPVQQIDTLLREATAGDILLTTEAHAELRQTFLQAGVDLVPQRALLSGLSMVPVSADIASRLTGAAGTVALGASSPSGPSGLGAMGSSGPPAQATLAGIAPGALLGHRFQILSVLGAGGMGVVYKARDRELDDLVALKMLKGDVAQDPDQLARLKSELKLARKITHPNVLRTFDFGTIDGLEYISMEYVRGVTLRFLLDREGRVPYSAGLRLAKQLCAGLGAAHAAGVLHRDIKPENLILDSAGNAKLMDFGIARPTTRLTPGQTQAGWVVGTPQYLSPEQIEGKEADERSDIYACGVVFHEIFTGHPPFRGDNPMQILLQHLHETPAPPTNLWPEMPKELEALILRCLEKDRDKRYRKVADLQAAFDRLSA